MPLYSSLNRRPCKSGLFKSIARGYVRRLAVRQEFLCSHHSAWIPGLVSIGTRSAHRHRPSHTHVIHCTDNPNYVFPEMELLGLFPNSLIHVSVSESYIPRIGLPICLHQNMQADPGNIWITIQSVQNPKVMPSYCLSLLTQNYGSFHFFLSLRNERITLSDVHKINSVLK